MRIYTYHNHHTEKNRRTKRKKPAARICAALVLCIPLLLTGCFPERKGAPRKCLRADRRKQPCKRDRRAAEWICPLSRIARPGLQAVLSCKPAHPDGLPAVFPRRPLRPALVKHPRAHPRLRHRRNACRAVSLLHVRCRISQPAGRPRRMHGKFQTRMETELEGIASPRHPFLPHAGLLRLHADDV